MSGSAPFYYNWPAEIGLIDAPGHIGMVFPGSGKLTGLLPGAAPRAWTESLEVGRLPSGRYKIAVRVPNRLKNGNPIRFANKTQDADLLGWLTVGEFRRP